MTYTRSFLTLRAARREYYAQKVAAAERAGNTKEVERLQKAFTEQTKDDYSKVKERRAAVECF